MNKAQSISPSAALRFIAVVGFAALTFFTGWVLLSLNFEGSYAVTVKLLTVIMYLLVIPGFARVLGGRSASRVLSLGVGAISVVTLLVLTVFMFGYMQDAVGVRCSDLWGWKAEPCIDSARFWLLYFGFLPYIYVPIVVAASAALAYQLVEDGRLSGAKATSRKRK